MLTSIIIPAYNAAGIIEKSISSALAQTAGDMELIIVDDASTDATIQAVEALQAKDPRIVLLKNETNLGVAETRNKGIAAATGKYIAFLDSDDIWSSEKLQKQLELLESTGADLCYASYRYMNQEGGFTGIEYIVPASVNYRGLLYENVIGCSTVVVKAEAFHGFKFKKEYSHEDYVLWLEMLKAGKKAVGLPQTLVDYRVGGRSANKLQAARDRWVVYRKSQRLSLLKSSYFFINYVLRAVRKYY